MSTQSLSKKLLVSALVALPFPYLLLIVAQFASALPNELSASAFLSSDQGASFYIVAWLIFLAASLIQLLLQMETKRLVHRPITQMTQIVKMALKELSLEVLSGSM